MQRPRAERSSFSRGQSAIVVLAAALGVAVWLGPSAAGAGAAANGPAQAIAIGHHPVGRLDQPATLSIEGPGRTIDVPLSGAPAEWVAAINARAPLTGVEALITDPSTRLEDGSAPDPEGAGYLLLRTHRRGRGAAVTVRFSGMVEATGFSQSAVTAAGSDAG